MRLAALAFFGALCLLWGYAHALQVVSLSPADSNAGIGGNAGNVAAPVLEKPLVFDFRINGDSFSKGDTIEISGTAARDVEIKALNGNRLVFLEHAKAADGNFSFSHKISFLDPSGRWAITVSDGKGTITRRISVSPTRESAFLALTFLSPSPTIFRRTENINVILRVTDAGQPLGDAIVYFWGLAGEKIDVPHTGEGIYSYTYRIPEDAETGKWELKVVASYMKVRSIIGGETAVTVTIEPSPLQVKLISPIAKEFYFGRFLNLKLDLLYSDGSRLHDGNVEVWLSQGDEPKRVPMKPTADGHFTTTIVTDNLKNRVLNVTINAGDIFGNSTEQFLQFEPRGYTQYFVKKNALSIVAVMAFLLALAFFWYKKSRAYVQRKRLLREKEKILSLKKKNQKNYLVDRRISRAIFDKTDAELNMKMKEVEAKLAELGKRHR
jgi:hypothetical protein